MDLTQESIEEFRTAEPPLLDNMELATLKSEVEAEVPPVKSNKRRSRHALDNPHVSATPAKKKKGEPGNKNTSISPMKRKAALKDSHTSTPPEKKTRCM